MANFIRNRVVIANAFDEQVKNVLDLIKSDESLVDFNKVVPMPSELNVDQCSLGELGRDYILSFYKGDNPDFDRINSEFNRLDGKRKEECLSLGLKYIENKVKFGYESWYDWRRANWGTKWNSSDAQVEDNAFSFETAWDGVVPIIAELSRKFPDVTFEYEFADEDLGYNVGKGVIKNGDIDGMTYPTGGTVDAYHITFDLWPECESDYKLVDGEYVYIEEDEDDADNNI